MFRLTLLSHWRQRGALTAAIMLTCLFGAPSMHGLAEQPVHAAATAPATASGFAGLRRLSEAQYRLSIANIFGPDIKVGGRFDPPLREAGLLAIGDGYAVVSPFGVEQFEIRAREVAAQVFAKERRPGFVPCAAPPAGAFDKVCAEAFLSKYGRLLFRRPLDSQVLASTVKLAQGVTQQTGSFDSGLEVALSRLLASPQFLFRGERLEADPDLRGALRLDAWSLAERVSFLLWNAPPDPDLLDAAASGALQHPETLQLQVDRLIASPRFEQGVRAFFSDMLALDQFNGLTKDQSIYPKFTSSLAADAREQMLRTIVDVLVTNRDDYRSLFTTRKTFMNRGLAALYDVPIENAAMDRMAGLESWVPYSFAPEDGRAGILTLAGFLMLDPSHEGRSSPTIRGKTIRELMLCQTVPPPPANVDFKAVENTKDAAHRTARERLAVHQENPVCAACHSLTDPIGLAMENFDAAGQFRTMENGARIDTTGNFDGRDFKDAVSFQQILHDSPETPNCVARRVFEYGAGRQLGDDDAQLLDTLGRDFAQDQYRFPVLMRQIAMSKAFRSASAKPVPTKTAAAHNAAGGS